MKNRESFKEDNKDLGRRGVVLSVNGVSSRGVSFICVNGSATVQHSRGRDASNGGRGSGPSDDLGHMTDPEWGDFPGAHNCEARGNISTTAMARTGWKVSELGIDFILCLA
ncbi:hypothetical protein QJS10_CPB18g02125 [Acorus calamus]|uniref:Uncharacterized protein n=1 Tax=Acorus calamus TaxID=4465 RepID=A0AAV9CME3_ACOCL|nr:hypothetical protein QJS10_CPB18g02125 [Acorus calamus]